ncbi:hypothetical protein PENTCL1PPCAC_15009, partial [Pristionchus entomophagus]
LTLFPNLKSMNAEYSHPPTQRSRWRKIVIICLVLFTIVGALIVYSYILPRFRNTDSNTTLITPTKEPEHDICMEEIERGRWCEPMSYRWYYHNMSQKCLGFHYIGCIKSKNLFKTRAACVEKCEIRLGQI